MLFTDTVWSAEIESGGILWDMVFKNVRAWRTMLLECLKRDHRKITDPIHSNPRSSQVSYNTAKNSLIIEGATLQKSLFCSLLKKIANFLRK